MLYGSEGGHNEDENTVLKAFQWIVLLKSSSVTSRGSVGVSVDELTFGTCLEAVLSHLRAMALIYPCFCDPKSERISGVFREIGLCFAVLRGQLLPILRLRG